MRTFHDKTREKLVIFLLGAAESEFFSWLEEELCVRPVSEVEVDERITGFRRDYSPPGAWNEGLYVIVRHAVMITISDVL